MKKIIQIMGGVLIAAAAVLIFINLYMGSIFGSLKEGAGKTDTATAHPKEEYEKAVLADPVFTYIGEMAKKAGKDYAVYEEIKVTDTIDGYERTLQEAIDDGRIRIKEIEIQKSKDGGLQEAAADVDADTGNIAIKESGIYQIKLKGIDEHNNPVKTDFLIAVNRKGV